VKFVYLPFVPAKEADIQTVISRLEVWYQSRGPIYTADKAKLSRLAVTRYLAGTPLTVPAGLSLTKDGLPKVLPDGLRILIREKNPFGISLCLTLLSITRSILGGKKVDYGPITDPTIYIPFQPLEDFITERSKTLKRQTIMKPKKEWESFHWSTKSGPNGPALQTAMEDFLHLPESLKQHLLVLEPNLQYHFDIVDKWVKTPVWQCLRTVFKLGPVKGLIRKLSIKPDREAKSRVFAIMDYWSQTALKPTHDWLFQVLKLKFPCDCTFNQGHGLTLRAQEGHSYHSFDLTSATDRFPASLQEHVLKTLLDEDKARAWRAIMTDYEFLAPDSGLIVKYNAGQPMGAHSSWPLFTLTHHLVVQYCAQVHGFAPATFDQYRILGDDIVIANDQVAAEYEKVITQILGVSISPTKTHVSKDTYELAKRWYFKGTEVTPFPVVAFHECRSKFHLLAATWIETLPKGFSRLERVGYNQSVSSLLHALGYRGRLLDSVLKKMKSLTIVTGLPAIDRSQRVTGLTQLLQMWGLSIRCTISEDNFIDLLGKIACQEYYDRQTILVDKIAQQVRSWNFRLVTELEKDESLGPDDQAELNDNWSSIVPFAVLSKKSSDARHSVFEMANYRVSEPSHIWNKIPETKVLAFPAESGIIPIRQSHLRVGATAVFVKDFIKGCYAFDKSQRGL